MFVCVNLCVCVCVWNHVDNVFFLIEVFNHAKKKKKIIIMQPSIRLDDYSSVFNYHIHFDD